MKAVFANSRRRIESVRDRLIGLRFSRRFGERQAVGIESSPGGDAPKSLITTLRDPEDLRGTTGGRR
jgi:hypothetical protein